MRIAVIAFFGLMANVANAIELTVDNYDFETEGKTVFLKFFAPWCGHCKKMKPTWDSLMEEFKDSKTQLIADVDCTSEGGKPLCEANGVRGYPTLKWGDPAGLEDYSGGRDLEALKKFAEEKLKPMCSPSNLDLCDKEHQKEIKKYLGMKESDLEKSIDAEKKKVDKIEEDFKSFVDKLQTQYKEAMEKKDKDVADIKASGLALMEKCLIAMKKNKHDEL